MLEGKGYENVLMLSSFVHIQHMMCGFVCLSLKKWLFYRYFIFLFPSLLEYLFPLGCLTAFQRHYFRKWPKSLICTAPSGLRCHLIISYVNHGFGDQRRCYLHYFFFLFTQAERVDPCMLLRVRTCENSSAIAEPLEAQLSSYASCWNWRTAGTHFLVRSVYIFDLS